jgi:predicted permease
LPNSTFGTALLQDIRFGTRVLARQPGFVAVAILSLALGIGATSAMFSVVYAVLVDPYPYRDSERIGQLVLTNAKGSDRNVPFTVSQYFEMQSRSRSMEGLVAFDRKEVVMTGSGLPEVVVQEDLSPNAFDFFGVPALMGRTFSASEAGAGRPPEPVAVISYRFWNTHFQGRREILGEKLRLNDKFYAVIGVLPIRFTWNDVDVYTPMDMRPGAEDRVAVFVRTKAGATQKQIADEFEPMLAEFAKQSPPYMYPDPPFHVKFLSVNDGILGKFQNTLLGLLAAVTLLLLIACGNVANLLLARAAVRESEMAVRISIGAGRMRLIRQLLTESVILALAGGILGVIFAYRGIHAVAALMPEYSVPHEAVIAMNVPVLCFSLAISILTGILFGLAPALQLSKGATAEALRSGKGSAISVRGRRLHNSLILVEFVLSLVLLTGAGLAIRGLVDLKSKHLGYNPENVLAFFLPLPEGRYTTWAQRQRFYNDLLQRLQKLPGASASAATITGLPPYNGGRSKFTIDGRPPLDGSQTTWNMVSGRYLETMGTPLLRGRLLDGNDIERASPVAVVSDDFVRKYVPQGQDPLGRHLALDLFTQTIPPVYIKAPRFGNTFEIVGVVATAQNRGLFDPPLPAIYLPYSLLSAPAIEMLIRTQSDPAKLTTAARQAVRAVDRDQPVTQVRTLEEVLNTATAYPRFATFLFSIFAAVGLVLAAAGMFSVVSYSVSHRRREFGIRMALGANAGDILRVVLGSIGRVLATGLFCGIALSVVLSRLTAGRMQGMGNASFWLFVMVPAVLGITALAACIFPAHTATRVEPAQALRHE